MKTICPDARPWKIRESESTGTSPLFRQNTKRENLEREMLLGGEFDAVISYMLEHDCKLEQEAVECGRTTESGGWGR